MTMLDELRRLKISLPPPGILNQNPRDACRDKPKLQSLSGFHVELGPLCAWAGNRGLAVARSWEPSLGPWARRSLRMARLRSIR